MRERGECPNCYRRIRLTVRRLIGYHTVTRFRYGIGLYQVEEPVRCPGVGRRERKAS